MLYTLIGVSLLVIPAIIGGSFLLSFWAQIHQANVPLNLASILVRMTTWFVLPVSKLFPGRRGTAWAALLGAILVALAKAGIEAQLYGLVNARMLTYLTLTALIYWVFYGFIGLLFIEMIFSWVNPYSPFAFFVREMTDPLLRPVRKVLPTLGRFDFSPMVVFILLQLGLRLAFRLLSLLL